MPHPTGNEATSYTAPDGAPDEQFAQKEFLVSRSCRGATSIMTAFPAVPSAANIRGASGAKREDLGNGKRQIAPLSITNRSKPSVRGKI
jgi:hypothetical protein